MKLSELIKITAAIAFLGQLAFSLQTPLPTLAGPYFGQKPPAMEQKIYSSGDAFSDEDKKSKTVFPLYENSRGIILFALQSKGDIHQLYSIDLNTSNTRKIIGASIGLNHAEWSPDGTKIACVGFMDRSFKTNSIHTLNADGTNLKRLTHIQNVTDFDPVWSPDGKQIIFTRIYPGPEGTYENKKCEIWLMNSDGSDQRYLGWEGFQAKFSPDGKKLLYTVKCEESWEIFTCNVDGTNKHRLTNNNYNETNAVWSPDGSRIAFDSEREGNNDIYITNSDGSNLRRITEYRGWDSSPKWSPDGTCIAFVSDRDGLKHWEIYTMNCDGTNIKRITNTPGENTSINPAWKPINH